MQQTVKWIADACDGDKKDLTRFHSVEEAIRDYELIYGEKAAGQGSSINDK